MPALGRAARRLLTVFGAVVITTVGLISPSLAKDPFRTTNPRNISDSTEEAFRAIFERGDYPAASRALEEADPNEPLTYALKSSVAYLNIDQKALKKSDPEALKNLGLMKENATRTRELAEKLTAQDPLRGNLYTAIGHLLEGATVYIQDQIASIPQVLEKLKEVFKYMNAAEAVDPKDPELSLLKGSMDLILSTIIPFSNPDQAVQQLSNYAAPRSLAFRSIAVAYRDLKQPDKALEAVDQALAGTPDNPEVLYLKAQILTKQERHQDALTFFDQALAKKEQLPPSIVKSLTRERDRAARRVSSASSK